MIGEPRNMQQAMGPSEIGSDCDHCVAAKLAGWEQEPEAAWLPWVGTAMHSYLEGVFEKLPDYLTETRVWVTPKIPGTSDLFHVPSCTVVDWKLVGTATLKSAKRGPSPQYRTQAHAYGLGFFRAGYDVKRVAIYYLPRNAMSLKYGVFWSEDWNPCIAIEALERLDRIREKLDSFPSVEARDRYISSLPRADHCWDCNRYSDALNKASRTGSLEALLGI